MIGTILLIFAFVFAAIAAMGVVIPTRVHFGWLAISFWILSTLLGGAHLLATLH